MVQGTQVKSFQDPLLTEAPTWTAFVGAVGDQLKALNEHLLVVEQQPERDFMRGNLLQLRQALQVSLLAGADLAWLTGRFC